MDMRTSLVFVCGFALTLCGCAVSPEVNYHLWSEPDQSDGWIPYQLTDSTLVIGVNIPQSDSQAPAPGATASPTPAKTKPSNGTGSGAKSKPTSHAPSGGSQGDTSGDENGSGILMQPSSHEETRPLSLKPQELRCLGAGCYDQTVSVVAVPISYTAKTYGIEPIRHWLVYTHIAPTYYDNSLRLKLLQVSVEDKRQETIDTVGALAVGSAKLMSPASGLKALALVQPQTLLLPVIIDLSQAKKAIGTAQDLPGNPGWKYQIAFLDDPASAGFRRVSDIANVHGAVVTSLCRPIAVTLTAEGTTLVMGTTVADPDYVVTVPLPPSGGVTFGTLCGADVSMTAVQTVKTDQVVSSFFNDVQQTRSALKAPSSNGAISSGN
jgi:hypothetical protein